MAESKKTEEDIDPIETYTMERVKYAQLTWTYIETEKKMAQMKASIIKTRTLLQELERLLKL